ncbi:MAG: hypothetical protein ABJ370_04750 [Paracoccaceae bacterium]
MASDWAKTFGRLVKAVEQSDPDEFEEALSACSATGKPDGLCELLSEVLLENWHFRHEDVAFQIQQLKCECAVQALVQRASSNPEYLGWDDNHALARKCTWALADIGTTEARHALERLAKSKTGIIRGFAQKRLDNWHLETSRKGH